MFLVKFGWTLCPPALQIVFFVDFSSNLLRSSALKNCRGYLVDFFWTPLNSGNFVLQLLWPQSLAEHQIGIARSVESPKLVPIICVMAPSSKFLDLLPPNPLPPMQKKSGAQHKFCVFLWKSASWARFVTWVPPVKRALTVRCPPHRKTTIKTETPTQCHPHQQRLKHTVPVLQERPPGFWAVFWEGDATKHFSVSKKGLFSEKGGGDSVNEGFGKDFYRKRNSVKRSRRFSEPPDSENWKVAVLIPFQKVSSF